MGNASVRTQKPWMRKLKVGDLMYRPNCQPRVIRSISFYKNGDLHTVTFVIKHCSWTKRCYTVMGYNDLNQFGYRPLGKSVPLRKRIDRKIARNLKYENRDKQNMTCCDVHGVG